MRMIPALQISGKREAKANTVLFTVRRTGRNEFQIEGKPYIGRVENIGGRLHVGCDCPAKADCYHMPHYLAAHARWRRLAGITTDDDAPVTFYIEMSNTHAVDVALERAEYVMRRIGSLTRSADELDCNDTEIVGRLAWEAQRAIENARSLRVVGAEREAA